MAGVRNFNDSTSKRVASVTDIEVEDYYQSQVIETLLNLTKIYVHSFLQCFPFQRCMCVVHESKQVGVANCPTCWNVRTEYG